MLVDLSLHETADFRNLEREVARVLSHLVLLYLQQARHLDIALRISLAGIPSDDVAQLAAVEQFLLVLHLHILRHQHGVSHLDAAVHLAKVALQHVTLLSIISLHLLILACTALVHLHLLVNQLVVYLDVIVVNLVLVAQFGLKLRSHGNVELEHQRLGILKILRLLLLIGQRLT